MEQSGSNTVTSSTHGALSPRIGHKNIAVATYIIRKIPVATNTHNTNDMVGPWLVLWSVCLASGS